MKKALWALLFFPFLLLSCSKDNTDNIEKNLTSEWWIATVEIHYLDGTVESDNIPRGEIGVVFHDNGTLNFIFKDAEWKWMSALVVDYETSGNHLYIWDIFHAAKTEIKITFTNGKMIWEMDYSDTWWYGLFADDIDETKQKWIFTK